MRIRLCRVVNDALESCHLQLAPGSTVQQALQAAGWTPSANAGVGIFGVRVELSQVLTADDRVELYHPLPTDPKERRRRRAMHPRPVR